MKIGQLFLPKGNYLTPNREKRIVPELVSLFEADSLTPFLIFESPVRTPRFVAFIVRPLNAARTAAEFNSTIVDLSPVLGDQQIMDGGVILEGSVVYDPAPLAWQLLMRNAAKDWKTFAQKGESFDELATIWQNHPDFFDRKIDRRKSPSLLSRQNSFIIQAWSTWDREGKTLQERVDDMELQGYGSLPPGTLQKRAERLFKEQPRTAEE